MLCKGSEVQMILLPLSVTLLLAIGAADAAMAADEPSDTELAQKTQNPVADMISLPFQNNTTYNSGPRERTSRVMTSVGSCSSTSSTTTCPVVGTW